MQSLQPGVHQGARPGELGAGSGGASERVRQLPHQSAFSGAHVAGRGDAQHGRHPQDRTPHQPQTQTQVSRQGAVPRQGRNCRESCR